MTPDQLERLWADPRHWSAVGIYRCAADPRIVVPKRRPWLGWTLNFAHPASWPVLVLAVIVPAALVAVRARTGAVAPGRIAAFAVCYAVLLVVLSHWESSRPR
jgi:hypothetical protein